MILWSKYPDVIGSNIPENKQKSKIAVSVVSSKRLFPVLLPAECCPTVKEATSLFSYLTRLSIFFHNLVERIGPAVVV
ncbi:hypothetical protein [Bacillus benzoevorans]|uniref:hypothetical protein n=1 Tax=Bacillus benzoevorans TaxID=1456 RepID=UPI001609F6B8|nr:hypothetical protein [Bacillus benzoevorans]